MSQIVKTACSAGEVSLIPGLGRSPGEGNDNPLQYCLENSMDREAWWATVHEVAKLDMTERLTLSLLSHITASINEIEIKMTKTAKK